MIATSLNVFFPAIVDYEQPLCFEVVRRAKRARHANDHARALPSLNTVFEEKEKLLAVYVDRNNRMKTGLNAATVSQVPCRKGTAKGFIMRHTHELLAL